MLTVGRHPLPLDCEDERLEEDAGGTEGRNTRMRAVTRGARWTFIVSLTQDESSGMSGIVEQVRTGRKERFRDLRALGTVIAEMLRGGSGGAVVTAKRRKEEEP